VTVAAFKTLGISNHTEQFIIEALRAANALTISLVAEVDGRVVGHIAFSPLTISDGTRNWYGLGPVSVLPEYQRQGIGKALIREGLSRQATLKSRLHACYRVQVEVRAFNPIRSVAPCSPMRLFVYRENT
jgi:putative acetyltransferase